MNWLHYLLEANLYLCIFYACYYLFLNKETLHTLNRLYLLFSCFISFVLPVLQIGALKSTPVEAKTTVFVEATHLNNQANLMAAPVSAPFTFTDILLYLYLSGVAVLTIVLLLKLVKLLKMIKNNTKLVDDKYRLISIEDSNTAFSFFNYLFIGTRTQGTDIVIRHELVHIRQKHSADIVFVELIKIVNWFNPFIYLLQISLKTIHEYIADEQTATHETDAVAYSSFLVDNAYGLNGLSITHSFFNYNLLKKRIIMLNQKRSGTLARLKYLVAAPVCGALLCASTLGFSKNYGWVDLAPKHVTAHVNNVAREASATQPSIKADTNPVTPKGYKYQETGYLIKGKTNYRVIITEKNGQQKEYFRNSATAADIKLLKDKYGYKFPTMTIHAALPPPPPAPPKPVKIANVPLALPATPAFDSLYKYMAKYVRYPAKARTNLVAGRIFVRFTVANGKIEDAKITRALDPDIDGEVLRVIKNFDGPLDPAFKSCYLPVSFTIIDKNGKLVGNPPATAKEHAAIKVTDAPSNNNAPDRFYTLNEVVVTTYL